VIIQPVFWHGFLNVGMIYNNSKRYIASGAVLTAKK